MKKLFRIFPVVFVLSIIGATVYAIQFNWGTSTGGAYNTPDDTTNKTNQFLQIGQGTQQVVANSTPTINATTIAVINASTPTSNGNLVFCLNCQGSPLCISTTTAGSPNGGTNSWVMVTSSFSVFNKCQ